MYKLNAGKRDLRRDEILESQHRPDAGPDRTVILLDQIIQILGRADRDRPPRRMLGEFSNGPVRGGVAVQRGMRPPRMRSRRFTQIGLRRADRAVAAEMRNRTLSALCRRRDTDTSMWRRPSRTSRRHAMTDR